MTDLVIVGAGGFGREVLDVVEAVDASSDRLRFRGFVDDGSPDLERITARGAHVLGGLNAMAAGDNFLIGIGDGAVRESIDRRLTSAGHGSVVLIHPDSTHGALDEYGAGTVITAGVRITTNVQLGRHVHVNINATVGHDCRIADYVTINPGVNVSGEVTIGERTMIGTGAAILQGLRIGADCVVGAGAVVTKDVAAGTTVVGAPARPIA